MALLCSSVLAVQSQPSNGVCNFPACPWGSLKGEIPSLWNGSFASLAPAKPGAGTNWCKAMRPSLLQRWWHCLSLPLAPARFCQALGFPQMHVIPFCRMDTPLPPNSVSKELSHVLPAPCPATGTPHQHGQTLPTWARGRCSPYLLARLSQRVRELVPSPALCHRH